MDLTTEVKEFIRKTGLNDANEINEKGYCKAFAVMVWQKYPETELKATDERDASIEGHFFVFNRENGLYFDSESPLGVQAPAKLKYFMRRRRHGLFQVK